MSDEQGLHDRVPEFYVNVFGVNIGAYDVLFTFAQEDATKEEVVRKEVVKLRTSHKHAWVMVKLLNSLMDKYVTDIGPFSLPKEIVERHQLQEEYNKMWGKALE